ncbi:MAG: efflux RND transporter periplasmic adaptor subunit [Rhizobiaceae bacterium]
MPRIRFHQLAAVLVLIASAAWVLTGEFSSVGSSTEAAAKASEEASAAEPAQPAETLPTVAFVKPFIVDHARAIRISGQTEADKRVVVTTRLAGIVKSIAANEGGLVKEGEVILELDPEERPAALANAKALLEQRQNELVAAEKLVKQGTMATLKGDMARSALMQAKWQVEQVEAEIARLSIVAPFSGTVDKIMVETGASVPQGAQVANLLSLDPIIARGEVSESDLRYVVQGAKAEVRLVDGTVVEGTVRLISREATPQTRTFPVEVEIANADRRIPAGMTTEIKLLADSVRAVALPRSVITLSATGDLGVRILKPDDTVAFVGIDLVDDMPQGLLLGGIPEEARIIVAGQDLVTEGDKVKAVEADPAQIQKLIGSGTAQ